MGFVDWNRKYTVHDPVMDEHHQEIFHIINELHTAALARHGKDAIGLAITKLIQHASKHFSAEETLMQSHHYPGYPEHKAAHESLIQQVHEFDQAFRNDHDVTAPDVFAFLVKEMLFKHILVMDLDYGPYLERGQATAEYA